MTCGLISKMQTTSILDVRIIKFGSCLVSETSDKFIGEKIISCPKYRIKSNWELRENFFYLEL
jgi:hypothetical protein